MASTSKKTRSSGLVEAVLQGKTLPEAYKHVYPTDPQTVITDELVRQYIVRNKQDISIMLNDAGLGLEYANSKLKGLIEHGSVPVVINNEIVQAEDDRVKTDNLKTLYKLHKALGLDNLTIQSHQNNFTINADQIDSLNLVADRFKALSDTLKIDKTVQDGEIV